MIWWLWQKNLKHFQHLLFSDMWSWTCWRPSGIPTSRRAFSGAASLSYTSSSSPLYPSHHLLHCTLHFDHFGVCRQFFAFSIYFCVSTVAFTLRHNQVHKLRDECIINDSSLSWTCSSILPSSPCQRCSGDAVWLSSQWNDFQLNPLQLHHYECHWRSGNGLFALSEVLEITPHYCLIFQDLEPVNLLATSLPDLEADLGSSIMEMANFRLPIVFVFVLV